MKKIPIIRGEAGVAFNIMQLPEDMPLTELKPPFQMYQTTLAANFRLQAIASLPTSGIGSEYGRVQRELAKVDPACPLPL